MRRTEEPLDPSVLAELDAIDAVLAGDPVDPELAELAELALLVAAERPVVEAGFSARLDERVERRFAPVPAPGATTPSVRFRRRFWGWSLGLGASAAAAAVVLITVLGGSGGGAKPLPERTGSTVASSAAASSGSAAQAQRVPAPASTQTLSGIAPAPRPPTNGRKIIQSANLQLSTAPGHIDAVAQELFDVVGRENGIVNNSTVTAGAGGFAQFALSIPSANLADTMTALSQLQDARVQARTDSTQDVNGQYINANRQLADDRALRTALLKRLAGAGTQTEIDSLKAQIHDAEQAIARDEAAVRSLNSRINFSRVEVMINSAPTPVSSHQSGGGFTLGKAAHDAGHVLTVVAGVALIVLAALVPVLLVAALGWWIASVLRRRRREQALDMA